MGKWLMKITSKIEPSATLTVSFESTLCCSSSLWCFSWLVDRDLQASKKMRLKSITMLRINSRNLRHTTLLLSGLILISPECWLLCALECSKSVRSSCHATRLSATFMAPCSHSTGSQRDSLLWSRSSATMINQRYCCDVSWLGVTN